ncbi:hypothetical protein J7M22_06945 [Candidatus Poribacteria bacterium]|nr:hypothetical protein [Candidatus Poribacteria bacterium]
MNEREILEGAEERIARYRMGEAMLKVIDGGGNPMEGVPVTINQIRSYFP